MAKKPTAMVFGAYGHTGRFVVAELVKRGFAVIISGRDAEKLKSMVAQAPELEARPASVDSPLELDHAVASADVVINCAGPFCETTEPLLQACLRSRSHYLDVSAEQSSPVLAFDNFDKRARAAGVTFLPAVAFFGGLGDLLATAAMGDWMSADEIKVGVAMSTWWPTQGTRKTITTVQKKTQPFVVTNGQRAPLDSPSTTALFEFSEPVGTQEAMEVPFSETPLIAQHIDVKKVRSYIKSTSIHDALDPSTPAPQAIDASGKSAQTFLLDVVVTNGDSSRRASASGRDAYATTAPMVVEAAFRLVQEGFKRPGAFALSELFNPMEFLTAVGPEHLKVQI